MPDSNKQLNAIKRRRLLHGIGVIGGTALAGCTSNNDDNPTNDGTDQPDDTETDTDETTSDGNQSDGGRLTFAQVKSPIEFDPIVLNDVPSAEVIEHVFQGLYTYDEGTNVVPELATGEPTIEDGRKRWIVEIIDGATFQNGDPVTAEDVKYSFEAPVKEETENAAEFEMIESVDVVDEKTAQFNLKYSYGAFNHVLAGASVIPKSVREADKQKFNKQQPVGSGPFEFVEWQEGNFASIQRWDDYWGDVTPNLSEVRFVPVEEPTTRVTSLKTGENDVIKEIPPKLYPQVESMSDAAIEEVLGIGYFYLAFNCANGPTSDPNVREAVDYCFSMDQAVKSFVEPTGERQYSPLPRPVSNNWNMPVDKWKQIAHGKDIDQAKQLFDDSDAVPDNWQPTIIVPPDDKREQIGITVANGLKEAGFEANVQRLDWGAFLDKYVSGDPNDYNMYTLGWSGTPDPDSFTYYLFAQEVEGVTNGTFYKNDEVNQQIVNARESANRDERKQMYESAITTLMEDRVHLPAYNLKNSFAAKSYVKDFRSHPVNSYSIVSDFNNVSMEQ